MARCIRPRRFWKRHSRTGHREDSRVVSAFFHRRDLRPEMTSKTSTAKPLPAQSWLELPERGTPLSLRLSGWVALHVGRWAARLLLYPIALYFVISASAARRASHEYLRRVLARCPRWWHVLRHFY